ncbi:hypothetical protein UT300005_14170 [Clostridium sp. CTA-5]
MKEDNKQRYFFNENKTKIKANQGHSIEVNLKLEAIKPSNILYHGTSTKAVNGIYCSGIDKMKRQYVHLSSDIETATKVGKRHGNLIIFEIDSQQMYKDGYNFYLSKNKLWLTDYVPVKYLRIVN